MPFIPNHGPECELKHKRFPATCRFCGENTVYIECTCKPPSKVFLHPSSRGHDGTVSYSDERLHKCQQMHKDVRDSIRGLCIGANLKKGKSILDILQEILGTQEDDAEMLESERVFRNFLREEIVKTWLKQLLATERYKDVYERIRVMDSSQRFKDVAWRVLKRIQ